MTVSMWCVLKHINKKSHTKKKKDLKWKENQKSIAINEPKTEENKIYETDVIKKKPTTTNHTQEKK